MAIWLTSLITPNFKVLQEVKLWTLVDNGIYFKLLNLGSISALTVM